MQKKDNQNMYQYIKDNEILDENENEDVLKKYYLIIFTETDFLCILPQVIKVI